MTVALKPINCRPQRTKQSQRLKVHPVTFVYLGRAMKSFLSISTVESRDQIFGCFGTVANDVASFAAGNMSLTHEQLPVQPKKNPEMRVVR